MGTLWVSEIALQSRPPPDSRLRLCGERQDGHLRPAGMVCGPNRAKGVPAAQERQSSCSGRRVGSPAHPSPIAKAEVLLDRAHFSPGATIQMRAQRSTPFSGLSNCAIMRSARTMAGRQTPSRTRTLCGLETGLGLDLKEEVDR